MLNGELFDSIAEFLIKNNHSYTLYKTQATINLSHDTDVVPQLHSTLYLSTGCNKRRISYQLDQSIDDYYDPYITGYSSFSTVEAEEESRVLHWCTQNGKKLTPIQIRKILIKFHKLICST